PKRGEPSPACLVSPPPLRRVFAIALACGQFDFAAAISDPESADAVIALFPVPQPAPCLALRRFGAHCRWSLISPHRSLTAESTIESGPLWRGRRSVGQPRDVGSPTPCQGAWICRHQGPKYFSSP